MNRLKENSKTSQAKNNGYTETNNQQQLFDIANVDKIKGQIVKYCQLNDISIKLVIVTYFR